MTLIEYFKLTTIEGIDTDIFEKVLRRESDEYRITTSSFGGFIVSGKDSKKTVGCITKYYTTEKGNKKMKKFSDSEALNCYSTRKHVDINNDNTLVDCVSCHLYCLMANKDPDNPCHRILLKK